MRKFPFYVTSNKDFATCLADVKEISQYQESGFTIIRENGNQTFITASEEDQIRCVNEWLQIKQSIHESLGECIDMMQRMSEKERKDSVTKNLLKDWDMGS